MANAFNREEVILFENVLEEFNSDNTTAKRASMFSQDGGEMQNRGDTVWRPSPQISTTVDGLDLTGNLGSITEMSVPATLSTIANVPFELDAKQMRQDRYMRDKGKSGAQALSARLNRAISQNVAIWGSLTVAQSAALTGFDDISLADALMVENDVQGMEKTMGLNARDYNSMAGDLAKRTLETRSERALNDGYVGNISGFETFKTSYQPNLAAAAGTVAVDGAQSYVPESTSTAATGETENVDNRTMDLTVDTTASVKAGDKFTIPNVNAVSHINKNDTLQLKTFTVVSVGDATTLQIAPPIIVAGASDAEDDYANCSAAAADLAALTFLNTTDSLVNTFWMDNSIEIFSGNLAFGDMGGVEVMREPTDSGLEIIFAKQGNVITGVQTYRLTMFFGTTNLNPEMNGVLIGGQT